MADFRVSRDFCFKRLILGAFFLNGTIVIRCIFLTYYQNRVSFAHVCNFGFECRSFRGFNERPLVLEHTSVRELDALRQDLVLF